VFKPREAFLTIEHFADHIADVIASDFRTTKHQIAADLAKFKDETAEEFDRVKSELSGEVDRLRADIVDLHSRIESAEKALTRPNPVNPPPAIGQFPPNTTSSPGQEESSVAGSSPTVTEGQ
jgi:hypothetical protein